MGDEPELIMPVGVNSYETHSYEINISILSSSHKNQGLCVLPVEFH